MTKVSRLEGFDFMEIKKGIRPGTEKRCELLQLFLDKGMSANAIWKYVKQMRGKSEEEKERIAEQIIQKLKPN